MTAVEEAQQQQRRLRVLPLVLFEVEVRLMPCILLFVFFNNVALRVRSCRNQVKHIKRFAGNITAMHKLMVALLLYRSCGCLHVKTAKHI